MYQYQATLDRVVDGDTVDFIIDLGFSISIKQRVRVNGIDTPEMRSSNPLERAAASDVKVYLSNLLSEGTITLKTYKGDKYGRMLADIYLDDVLINEQLVELKYAKRYHGSKKEEWKSEDLLYIVNN